MLVRESKSDLNFQQPPHSGARTCDRQNRLSKLKARVERVSPIG